ncbi:conserved hypothetical protein [Thermotomaculum hydrothermale]|uniref:DUF2520 domain-containing protein n=1 Tax=Thermotomaculum hydrothermale TaxID=981385 RepID=A0A7R6PJA4_9BACT|nr:DUF2520 domain-containing protein [Thermotomaculum hydrothermale]BBB33594.1 conserved hypothetical protein [Thermotomaculum hydrothermale]
MRHFVIGNGRLGQTLFNSLKNSGEEIADSIEKSDIVWIVIPDSFISQKVREIEPFLSKNHILVHCSGFFPASILENAKTDKLVSLHPAYSFSKPLSVFPENIFWTFQGDKSVFGYFSNLVKLWKGKIKKISEKQKAYYHIACIFASNFPVVSLMIAEKLFEKSGIEFNDIRDGLVNPVCLKVADNLNLKDILTGPAKRKDRETILKEIEFLKKSDEDLSEIYRLLSDFVLKNV